MEKLMHILHLLAKSNPQQQEQILQRMPHLTAEQKQQLIVKAQTRRHQLIQQQQQQMVQQQQQQQGFGGASGGVMGGNCNYYIQWNMSVRSPELAQGG